MMLIIEFKLGGSNTNLLRKGCVFSIAEARTALIFSKKPLPAAACPL